MSDPVPITTDELAERLGISYRQLDYWLRRDYLPIEYRRPGKGVHRLWSGEEVRRAAVFAALINAGFTPAGASSAIESLRPRSRRGRFTVSPGSLLIVGRIP